MRLRWKMLVGFGAALIAVGLIGDWPPKSDPSLPETRSFLLFLGGLVFIAGLAIGIRQEK